MGYNEIRSMSGRYASYWNAFLLHQFFIWLYRGYISCKDLLRFNVKSLSFEPPVINDSSQNFRFNFLL